MEETFRLTISYNDRKRATVGTITITDEALLDMLKNPTVRLELARTVKLGNNPAESAVRGMFLAPLQLEPASKLTCGDLYEHDDGHTYYCNLKPKHGDLHDSLVDEFDLYDGESVTWLDAKRRVDG